MSNNLAGSHAADSQQLAVKQLSRKSSNATPSLSLSDSLSLSLSLFDDDVSDLYGSTLGLSPVVDAAIAKLLRRVDDEVETQQELMPLVGMADILQ